MLTGSKYGESRRNYTGRGTIHNIMKIWTFKGSTEVCDLNSFDFVIPTFNEQHTVSKI